MKKSTNDQSMELFAQKVAAAVARPLAAQEPEPVDQFRKGCSNLEERFLRFHRDNPQVLDAIIGMVRIAQSRGHVRLGIGMIFEVLRWETMMATSDSEGWKLNNSWRSRYVRLIEGQFPDLRGVFEKRRLKS